MLFRGIVVLFVTILLSLLPGGKFHHSQAHIQAFHPDSLWAEWGDVSIRLRKADKLADYFSTLHRKRKFNGAVLIAERGTVIHQQAYGNANFRTKEPLTLNSSFQLASLSKIFTAAAVMVLYEDGKLDFDDYICEHIPGWPYDHMTIRHLLNHRSGMARYMAVASWHWKDYMKPMSNEDVLNQYVEHSPIYFFRPGRGFNYCNTNYVILASLVEKVSGMPFEVFMKKRIFQPLEMKNSMIYSRVTDADIPNEAIGYKASWRGYRKAPNDYIDGVFGDKGMYASVNDLFKFDRALAEHELLSEETLEYAFQAGAKGWRSRYGFGWRLKDWEGDKLVYHFGWWRGFRTCFIRDISNDRTIIVLTNKDHPGLNIKYWNIYKKVREM